MSHEKNSDKNTNERKTLIEFPCDFKIKVMGYNTFAISEIVDKVILKHSPHMNSPILMTENLSKNKKYISVTATIEAINQEQLDNIYRELHSHEATVMVL